MNNEINVNTNENTVVNNQSAVNKKKFHSLKEIWNDSMGFKPILSYMYFLFVFLMKKKGTWIIPIISFVIIVGYCIVPSFINTGSFNMSSFLLYFGIVISVFFAISFTVVKVINIFKDGQDEGIEIIIVSKPIERWQIITAKFTMFILAALFITLLNAIALSIGFAISWDYNTTPEGFGNTIGIVIGGTLLVCLFFGSVAVLCSLKFGKKLSANLPTSIFSLLFGVSMVTSMVPSMGITPTNTADSFVQSLTSYNAELKDLANYVILQKLNYNNKNMVVVRLKNDTSVNNADSYKYNWNYVYPLLMESFNKSIGSGDWLKALKWLNVVNIPLDNETGFQYMFGSLMGPMGINGSNQYLNNSYYGSSSLFDSDYSYKLSADALPKNEQGVSILPNYYNTNSYNSTGSGSYGIKLFVKSDYSQSSDYQTETWSWNTFSLKSNYYGQYDSDNIIDELTSNNEFIDYVMTIINSTNSINYTDIINNLVINFKSIAYENVAGSSDSYKISLNKYKEFLTHYLNLGDVRPTSLFNTGSYYKSDGGTNDWSSSKRIYYGIDSIPTMLLLASFNIMYNTYNSNPMSKLFVNQVSNLGSPIESSSTLLSNMKAFRFDISDEYGYQDSEIDGKTTTLTNAFDIKIGATKGDLNSSATNATTLVPDSLPYTKINNINQPITDLNQNSALVISQDINQAPVWGIILLWFFISIGLLAFSIWTYTRRDFR